MGRRFWRLVEAEFTGLIEDITRREGSRMSASSAKEQRRNLTKAIGETAAAAVAEARGLVHTLQLQHQTLARQMLAFETMVAGVREARAADRERIAMLEGEIRELAAEKATLNLRVVDLEAALTRRGGTFDLLLAARVQHLEGMGVWRRLAWFLRGKTLADD
jgi:chromosome segregation ATPase